MSGLKVNKVAFMWAGKLEKWQEGYNKNLWDEDEVKPFGYMEFFFLSYF